MTRKDLKFRYFESLPVLVPGPPQTTPNAPSPADLWNGWDFCLAMMTMNFDLDDHIFEHYLVDNFNDQFQL